MKIALGSDHRGVEAVRTIAARLAAGGHEVDVLGPASGESSDYPDSAWLVARAVRDGTADAGVLVCGSGIGMCMAANKVDGVRAGLAHDDRAAEMMRRHNDANVICLAADDDAEPADPDRLLARVRTFLETAFEGGRHQRRVDKIARIEAGEDPGPASRPAGSPAARG